MLRLKVSANFEESSLYNVRIFATLFFLLVKPKIVGGGWDECYKVVRFKCTLLHNEYSYKYIFHRRGLIFFLLFLTRFLREPSFFFRFRHFFKNKNFCWYKIRHRVYNVRRVSYIRHTSYKVFFSSSLIPPFDFVISLFDYFFFFLFFVIHDVFLFFSPPL